MKLLGLAFRVVGVAAGNAEWFGMKGRGAMNICKTMLFFALLCLCLGPPADAGAPGAEGDLYVTSDTNNSVVQYDGTTGEVVGTFASGGGILGASGLVFTPNCKLLVGGWLSRNVVEFDGTTGAFIRVFASGFTIDVDEVGGGYDLALGPNGNVFVTNNGDHNVLEFDVTTGALLGVFASGGGLQFPEDLIFGPNGNLFVTSTGGTNTVLEYDGNTGAFIRVFASGGLAYPVGLVFKPDDGNLLVASISNNKIIEYDGTTGGLIGVFVMVSRPVGLVYGPNGHLFAAIDSSDTVEQFNGDTGVSLGAFTDSPGLLTRPYRLVFKPFDGDGDGVNDCDDACPDSDLGSTIVINGDDTGVENELVGDGCSLADLIAEVLAEDPTTGDIVQMLVDLKAAGLLTGQEMGAMLQAMNGP